MQIEITKKFGKQVEKCHDKKIRSRLSETIQDIVKANSLSELRNVKKLKGYNSYYRIRIGDYRIGISYENNIVVFAAFDHRSDIYKYFP
jgi:mRNA interferase RelE/StbE